MLYEGCPYKLRLPSPIYLAELIVAKGPGCLMFKIDLAHAHIQLPSDPWDWPLLGLSWNDDIYFDKAIPLGIIHGAMACQRTTDSLCHSELALIQYDHFFRTIKELGLQVSRQKCISPFTFLTWIGASFDSI